MLDFKDFSRSSYKLFKNYFFKITLDGWFILKYSGSEAIFCFDKLVKLVQYGMRALPIYSATII